MKNLQAVSKKSQIFINSKNLDDVVLLLRDFHDCKALQFINDNKLKFRYYPDVSAKSGFNSENQNELFEKLNSEEFVSCIEGVRKNMKNTAKNGYVEINSKEYIGKILKALNIPNKPD